MLAGVTMVEEMILIPLFNEDSSIVSVLLLLFLSVALDGGVAFSAVAVVLIVQVVSLQGGEVFLLALESAP
jgi:hypothetical protein